jgi:hypothetical protein
MTLRSTAATALRVLAQLRRDPRTIVLIVGVPCLLETPCCASERAGRSSG